jgi:hypothetical protein
MRFLLTSGQLAAAAGTPIEGNAIPVGPQPVRILSAHLSGSDAISADASNFVTFQVLNGTTAIASWSTQTTAQGALTADTPVDLSVTRSGALVAAGGQIKFAVTSSGSGQTVEAGMSVWCELLNALA